MSMVEKIKMLWDKTKVFFLSLYDKLVAVLRLLVLPGFNGMPLYDVLVFFLRSFTKGRLLDRAASVAFNFFLAIFPLILFLFTLIPYIPIRDFQDTLFELIRQITPVGTFDVVQQTIFEIINHGNTKLLSVSILMAFLFGSSGISAIFDGFKNVYLDTISATWMKQRLNSIILLVVIGLLLIISIALITIGNRVIDFLVIDQRVTPGPIVILLIFARWLIPIIMTLVSMSLLYYFGNSEQKKFKLFTPGSIFSTGLFILAVAGFNVYISNFSSYNALYGSIGTLIILLLWLYIIAIVILTGNDLNVSIAEVSKNQKDIDVVQYSTRKWLSQIKEIFKRKK